MYDWFLKEPRRIMFGVDVVDMSFYPLHIKLNFNHRISHFF